MTLHVYQYQTHLYIAAIAVVRGDFLVVLTHTVWRNFLVGLTHTVWRDFLVVLTHTVRRDFLVVLTHTVRGDFLVGLTHTVRGDFLVVLTHMVYQYIHDDGCQIAAHGGSLLVQNHGSRTTIPYSKPIT